jgi:hypothetical protein
LLTERVAADSWAQLEDQTRRRNLYFGDRPLATVLRPRLLMPEQYADVRRRVGVLLGAFGKAYAAALADPAVRAQFAPTEQEEELLRDDPGFAASSPTGRLDTFFSADLDGEEALKIVEYNAETPAAPAYNDVLTEVFLGLPIMGAFLQRYEVRPLPARHNVLHALLRAFAQWSGGRERPRIGILDWREVVTYSEHLLFAEYFNAQGVPAVTCDPRTVEYRDGKLMAGDFHVTLIYKRVLISELLEREGVGSPVVRAVRDGAVCMVNPWRCKLLHKKASLAVLSDERNAGLYSAAEQAAIAAHVPWTRRVEERHTEHDGQRVDLVPFIAERRERMVLKANDEYGGKGIVLGWQTPPAKWERAIETALAEPFVVQERVAIPEEPYPTYSDGRLHIFDRILDTAPFVYDDAFADGCLTRLSTEALVNVTAGGGSSVPTFVVAKR